MSMPDYLIALDFESTCDENYASPDLIKVKRDIREIIEVPIVVVATRSELLLKADYPNVLKAEDGSFVKFSKTSVIYEYRSFIQPVETPITPYCTQLTGITEKMVEDAPRLLCVLLQVQDWIASNIEAHGHSFAFVTHGHFDIRNMLFPEAQRKGFLDMLKPYWFRFFDVTAEVSKWFKVAGRFSDPTLPVISIPTNVHLRQRLQLYKLCQLLGVFPSGRLHSGLDDARLIAALVRHLLELVSDQSNLFINENAQDIFSELELCKQEQGRHVLLDSLPLTMSKAAITDFLTSKCVPLPINMWRILDEDDYGTGLFSLEFGRHEDCQQCLELCNGAVINRCILVTPLNMVDLQQVQKYFDDLKEDFEQENRIEKEKSDFWCCPSCSYANFANQRVCTKCTHLNNSITGRPGNWICYICSFDNFSMRLRCLRCKVPHPTKKLPACIPCPPRPLGTEEWFCRSCGWINRPRPGFSSEPVAETPIKKGSRRPYCKVEQCFRCDRVRVQQNPV